jgi:DnaJ-class molecular chaperone
MRDQDVRVIDCEHCEGSGRIELTPLPTPYGPHTTTFTCWCGGSGKTTVWMKPITLEDLDDGEA